MLVVRGTKQLRDRLPRTRPVIAETSTTTLGDWYATFLRWRRPIVLLVNERTYFAVLLPLAPAASLLDRIPVAITEALRGQGASEAFIAQELAEMEEVYLGPTTNRSVVGVMSEYSIRAGLDRADGIDDPAFLASRLSGVPIGPLRDTHGFANRALAALVGDESDPRAFELKVTLKDTKPPIWRRVRVLSDLTLADLHRVIQAAMGWSDHHLFDFVVGRVRYTIPDPDFGDDFFPMVRDARRTRLSAIATVGTSFRYTYDFGDGWEHAVTVEREVSLTGGERLLECVDGRRACPPEDCGGPWGYMELLSTAADPSHPDHRDLMTWLREGGIESFDPREFSAAEATARLRGARG